MYLYFMKGGGSGLAFQCQKTGGGLRGEYGKSYHAEHSVI